MAGTYTYDHTHYKCSDPEKTVQWFKDHFGAKEVRRRTVRNILIISLDAGGTIVNFSPRVANEDVEERPAKSRWGVYHICFAVKDLDARAAELKARGVKFTVEPTQVADDLKISFVEGPDGISVEVLEHL
jgi:catechol 2,3-dioxygenase-like lactoylglutathione lyase family enzyme